MSKSEITLSETDILEMHVILESYRHDLETRDPLTKRSRFILHKIAQLDQKLVAASPTLRFAEALSPSDPPKGLIP